MHILCISNFFYSSGRILLGEYNNGGGCGEKESCISNILIRMSNTELVYTIVNFNS